MLMFEMSVAKDSIEVYTWSGGWLVMNSLKRSHAVAALTGSEDGTGTLTAGVFFVSS